MTKRITFPKCGTCDLTVPIDGEPNNFWCHGGTPGVYIEIVAVTAPGSNEVKQEKRTSSCFAPVGKDTTGCIWHPEVGKKLGIRK